MNDYIDLYNYVWQEIINGEYHNFGYLEDFYSWYDDFLEMENLTEQYSEEEIEGAKRDLEESLVEAFDFEHEKIEEDDEEDFYREDFTGPVDIY